MDTIQVKGTYTKVQNFKKTGGELFSKRKNNEIFENYNCYLMNLEQSDATIERKLAMLYQLLTYLEANNIAVRNVSKVELYKYLDIIQSFDYSLFYKDSIKLNLKLFFNWSYQYNYSKISGDMLLPKIIWHHRTSIRTYYTKEEVKKLINVIDTKTDKGKEHFLIISLICYLGLRISDVVNLKLSDIDFNENTICLIQYKTNEKLFLPLINQIKYPLIDYLKNVRPNDCQLDYVFVTTEKPYRHKIELKKHSKIVKKYMIKAEIDINNRKTGFHALRHSFSTILLSENVSLYSISTILGHKAIDTTMLYLDIDISKLKELALEVPIC